jgi:hypothetical protein
MKNEMGGVCSTYGWEVKVHTGIWWGNLRERAHLGDSDIDGRIILKWTFNKWDVAETGLGNSRNYK